ncbi:MAG: Twitching mobility protein [Phycisphaerae bacterium]|nr:Twitching mobility protein [Phycisphaerae bacterium]
MTTCPSPLMDLLRQGIAQGASDLLVVVGSPPCLYVHGRLVQLPGSSLIPDQVAELLLPLLNDDQQGSLQRQKDVDFSLSLPGLTRCRVNLHYQRGTLAGAFRYIPSHIPTITELQLPDVVHEFAQKPQGLILVTGPTGQGKSTTLAAMINFMNQTIGRHIITLEDPIEYLFSNQKCVIEQRELLADTPSFSGALRHVLRQRPEVILIGEMRDYETIATALTAAETGQLVMGTLHTMSAAQTVERIVDMFEGRQQQQIRVQLAHTLQAVIAQVLFKDLKGSIIPACEVLVATDGIRRAIRDNQTHLIPSIIETGAKYGMQTFDQAITALVREGRIAKEDAALYLNSSSAMDRLGLGGNTKERSRSTVTI